MKHLATPDSPSSYRLMPNEPSVVPPEFWLILRYKGTIAAAVLIAMLIGLMIAVFGEDRYTSTARLLIENRRVQFGSDGALLTESALSDGLVDSQVEVLSSNGLGLRVVDALALDQNPEFVPEKPALTTRIKAMLGLIEISEPTPAARRQTALGYYKEHLRASRVGMTFVVELKFSSLDPNLAADVLGRLVSEYLEVQAYQNARAAETATSWLRERVRGTGPTAQIIAEPLAPLVPSGLGTIPMLVGFAMLGLFAGLGVAIVRTMTDRRVRDAHELGRLTDTPYFGALPRLNSRVGPARLLRAALDNPMGPFSQTLQVVTADILGRGSRAPASVLAVASACGSEGKTVVAANLAALIASASGHRVLLVDGARANPTLTDTLASGLLQLPQDLKDKPALESVETDVLPGVDLLPVGCFAAQGASTLEIWSPGTETLIAELRQYYRHVLFDLSADSDSIDLRQAGAMLEALVLVVGTHTSDRDALEDLLGRPELRTKIRGTVLNQGHPPLRFPGLSQFASMGAMSGAVRRFQTGRKPKAKPQPAPAAAPAKAAKRS